MTVDTFSKSQVIPLPRTQLRGLRNNIPHGKGISPQVAVRNIDVTTTALCMPSCVRGSADESRLG